MPVHAKATAKQTAVSRCRIRVPAARIADIALEPHRFERVQAIRLGETLTGPLEECTFSRRRVQAIEGALMTRCATGHSELNREAVSIENKTPRAEVSFNRDCEYFEPFDECSAGVQSCEITVATENTHIESLPSPLY